MTHPRLLNPSLSNDHQGCGLEMYPRWTIFSKLGVRADARSAGLHYLSPMVIEQP
jgi:hypothetical protein